MMNINLLLGQIDLLSKLPYDIYLRIIAGLLPTCEARTLLRVCFVQQRDILYLNKISTSTLLSVLGCTFIFLLSRSCVVLYSPMRQYRPISLQCARGYKYIYELFGTPCNTRGTINAISRKCMRVLVQL